jgi:hypothetical protein
MDMQTETIVKADSGKLPETKEAGQKLEAGTAGSPWVVFWRGTIPPIRCPGWVKNKDA